MHRSRSSPLEGVGSDHDTTGAVCARNRANLPIFTFPGLSCLYMGINYYQIFLVYLIFPVALMVYVYLSYRVVLVLMQRKKRCALIWP